MHGMRPVMPGQSHGNLPSFRSTSILVSSSLHPTRPPKIAYQFAAICHDYARVCIFYNKFSISIFLPPSILFLFLSTCNACFFFNNFVNDFYVEMNIRKCMKNGKEGFVIRIFVRNFKKGKVA